MKLGIHYGLLLILHRPCTDKYISLSLMMCCMEPKALRDLTACTYSNCWKIQVSPHFNNSPIIFLWNNFLGSKKKRVSPVRINQASLLEYSTLCSSRKKTAHTRRQLYKDYNAQRGVPTRPNADKVKQIYCYWVVNNSSCISDCYSYAYRLYLPTNTSGLLWAGHPWTDNPWTNHP